MKKRRFFRKTASAVLAGLLAVGGLTGFTTPAAKAETTTLSAGASRASAGVPRLAVYNQVVTADSTEGWTAFQWKIGKTAALETSVHIAGATAQSYTPVLKDIGGWLFCVKTKNGAAGEETSVECFRVAAAQLSDEHRKTIEYPGSGNKIEDYDLAFISNTVDNYGKIDPGKWAPGGWIEVAVKGISVSGSDNSAFPKLDMGTWSVEGKESKQITADEVITQENGEVILKYNYAAMFSAWYNDGDFQDLRALRLYYAGGDKENMEIVRANYAGPVLSYGDVFGKEIKLRGSHSYEQFQFTAHVGGPFDATKLRRDDEFYVEYQEDKKTTLHMALKSHSARAPEDVENTYVDIAPYETGETASGYYSRFKVNDIIKQFGENFRYLDGLHIIFTDGRNFASSDAALYLVEGSGELVDDISASGYARAVDVPWTLYKDSDAKIAVIGDSITQNPLVTPESMRGEPYYAERGSWGAILDRTDIVTYGIGSQTTDDITVRFHEVLKYDKIIIQCGINDLGNYNSPQEAAAAITANYRTMLDLIAEEDRDIQVYIFSQCPVSKTTDSNVKTPVVMEAMEDLIKGYSNVTYIKIFDEFKDPDKDQSQEDLVMDDGLHPVAKGYAVYAKHLKEALASHDGADTSLVSLSWRRTGADGKPAAEKKNIVTGFASGDSGNKTYDVALGKMAGDAIIRLYETANNLDAVVTAENGEILTESYQVTPEKTVNGTRVPAVVKTDDYVEVKLENGRKTVKLTVQSQDKSQTSTYTINFTAEGATENEAVYEGGEKAQTLTDDNCVEGSWPYIQWNDEENDMENLQAGRTYRMEFDVEIENRAFTCLYIEGKPNWAGGTNQSPGPEAFEENILHVSQEFTPEDDVTTIAIAVGGPSSDYRGSLTVKNLKIFPTD